MKYIFILLLSISVTLPLSAQENSNNNFTVMSGYGYSYGEFAQGLGNINSFVYNINKTWGVGLDLGTTIGSDFVGANSFVANKQEIEYKITTFSVGPNAYLFAINNTKHQLYISAGVSYSQKNNTTLISEVNQDNMAYKSWDSRKQDIFGLNASLGYNYKISNVWSVGLRSYFNLIEDYYSINLLNVSMAF